MMKAIFVAGTDTAVGKTVVSSLLAKYLRKQGLKVISQKWVKTGCRTPQKGTCPYTFKLPASPHLASKSENKSINPQKIIKSFQNLSSKFDFVIVEGTGGILVPLNHKILLIDIVKSLGLPVLLVAQNKLGAINHTLLTIEALKKRKIKILGIIFNNLKKQRKVVLQDNPLIIKTFAKVKILGVLPDLDKALKLFHGFLPIGEKLCQVIR